MKATRNNFLEGIEYMTKVLSLAYKLNLQVTIDEKNWVVIIGIPKYRIKTEPDTDFDEEVK